jgi:hypothetical protein
MTSASGMSQALETAAYLTLEIIYDDQAHLLFNCFAVVKIEIGWPYSYWYIWLAEQSVEY